MCGIPTPFPYLVVEKISTFGMIPGYLPVHLGRFYLAEVI
jgi:hypothetical protein